MASKNHKLSRWVHVCDAKQRLTNNIQPRTDVPLYASNPEEHDHVVVSESGKIFDVMLPEKDKDMFLKTLWAKNPHLPKKATASVVVHV